MTRLQRLVGVLMVLAACTPAKRVKRIYYAKPAHVLAATHTLPIVLMHGMAGFDTFVGQDYFVDVTHMLRADGYVVLATSAPPLATVPERAEHLRDQIEKFLAKTGAKKAHLVGHSQGGLDARYLVSRLGFASKVATVTTIATPHRGTKIADQFLTRLSDGGVIATSALSSLVGSLTSSRANMREQLKGLSAKYMTEVFNPSVPNVPGVTYYSYAGRTHTTELLTSAPEHLSGWSLLSTYLVMVELEGENDGLVSVRSAKWGEFLGTIQASHLDQIGRPFAWFPPDFDHLTFFRQLAAFLHARAPPPDGKRPRYPTD